MINNDLIEINLPIKGTVNIYLYTPMKKYACSSELGYSEMEARGYQNKNILSLVLCET